MFKPNRPIYPQRRGTRHVRPKLPHSMEVDKMITNWRTPNLNWWRRAFTSNKEHIPTILIFFPLRSNHPNHTINCNKTTTRIILSHTVKTASNSHQSYHNSSIKLSKTTTLRSIIQAAPARLKRHNLHPLQKYPYCKSNCGSNSSF